MFTAGGLEMGLLSTVLYSLKKAWRVRKLSLIIAKQISNKTYSQEIYKNPGKAKEQALNDLFDLIQNDLLLKAVLLKHKATRTHLEELYYKSPIAYLPESKTFKSLDGTQLLRIFLDVHLKDSFKQA